MKQHLKTLKSLADKLPIGAVEVKTERKIPVNAMYEPQTHDLPSGDGFLTSEFKLLRMEWRPSKEFIKTVGKDFPLDQVPAKHKEYYALYSAVTPINHFLRLKKAYERAGWKDVLTYIRKHSDPNIVDELVKIIIQSNKKY